MEWIFNLLASLLGWYLKNNAKNEQAQRDLIAFAEIMNRNGLKSVKMRLEAVHGIDKAKDMGEQEEKEREEKGNL